MHVRRMLSTGLLGLSLIVAGLIAPATAAAASSPTAATAATTTCSDRHWPASVQGRPTLLHEGGPAGDYIWHDATGWHLRVTHATSARRVFTGRISADAAMTVTPFRTERGDSITLSADKKTITYKFNNYGHVDGLDFRTACAHRVTFSGSAAGAKLPISRIWIGHRNQHPLENPFVIIRVS
jgi:ABC-type transport system substrate-binding protein